MFSVAHLVVTLSPRPNVFLVLKNSVVHGWTSAFITVLGNLSCQLILICLVALGVGELLQKLPSWFIALKFIGGLYLIYVGLQNIRASRRAIESITEIKSDASKTGLALYIEAFLVSASNPKTLVFLSAFLPQFLDIEHSHLEQFTVMFISIGVIVTLVHLCYALLIAHLGKRFSIQAFKKKMLTISGGVFIAMGGGILVNSRG